jgi:hypothetical protein
MSEEKRFKIIEINSKADKITFSLFYTFRIDTVSE